MHTTGGYLTQVVWTHRNVFDIRSDEDVYWCAADVGWVTGHSYIVYGPLANRTTSVLYEGAPVFPDKDRPRSDDERDGVDVDEHGSSAAQLDGVRGGRERVGGNDHLVAGADLEGEQREV